MTRNCGNCKHFAQPGVCRQEPPKLISADTSAFPPVPPHWACGRFKLAFWRAIKRLFLR